MKQLIYAFALIFGFAMTAQDQTVQDLWNKYDKSMKADKPKDAMTVLDQIKKESLSRHLAWDYYDAGMKYVSAGSSINWKDRKSLEENRRVELRSWGEPVAVFYDMSDFTDRVNLMHSRRKELSGARNPEFYKNDWRIGSRDYSKALVDLLENDYDYALWSLFLQDQSFREAMDKFGGTYPMGALLEYEGLKDKDLAGFISRYQGKAAALLARQRQLQQRFNALEDNPGTSSTEFRAFRTECERFISERDRFSGTEKAIASCCTIPESLIEAMDSKNIDASVLDSRLTLCLRNIVSVNVKVISGKNTVLLDKTLRNDVGSYHRPDTVKFDLTVPNDGEYTIRCTSGKIRTECNWERYTLSIASRTDSEGAGVFVADFKTGEPLSSCDISLLGSDGSVLETAAGFKLRDGFTPLPSAMQKKIAGNNRNLYLRASAVAADGGKRMSDKMYASGTGIEPVDMEDNPSTLHCTILPDRSAFNPGETVRFKVIAYQGTYEYITAPAGLKLEARLMDPRGKVLATQPMSTGEFGSAAGEFLIPAADRNGMFRIEVVQGKTTLESVGIRVDEFILPSFSLQWDAPSEFYLPGDTIHVGGTVRSYSGHNLTSANISYKVERWGDSVAEDTLKPGTDGRFDIEFKALPAEYTYYSIKVTVSDATGETLAFSTTATSSKDIPVFVELDRKASGSFRLSERSMSSDDVILGTDKARLKFRIGTPDLTHKGLSIEYRLKQSSKVVCSGSLSGTSDIDLDLSRHPSGLFILETEASAPGQDGVMRKTEKKLNIIKVSDSDTALGVAVDEFFKDLPEDGGIGVQVGVTDGPAWIVAELFADGNVRLDGRLVRMDGRLSEPGSLANVVFPRPAGSTSPLTLHLMYFHDGECHEYSRTVEAEAAPSYAIPLEFTRFLDTTSPSADFTFSFRTAPGAEIAATVFDKSSETIYPNIWTQVQPYFRSRPWVKRSSCCGRDGESYPVFKGRMVTMANKSMGGAAVMMESVVAAEEAFDSAPVPQVEAVAVRENFSPALAWEPFLRSDENGDAEFRFSTSDKLSTYLVQLFSHDKSMHNAVLRSEMTVTIPVKVAVVQPRYLYEGDRYVARVTLSNGTANAVSGKIDVRFLDGDDYKTAPVLRSRSSRMTVPAGGSSVYSCDLEIPSTGCLGLLVTFTSDGTARASDAVFVTVPVSAPEQTITESHSALLPSGADASALEKQLRSSFVNTPGEDAVVSTISIRQMLADALPKLVEADGEDLLSQLDAFYCAVLADRLGQGCATEEQKAGFVKKIIACRGAAGGYGWFEGMDSSPVITAALLEKASVIGDAGPLTRASLAPAVSYLDQEYFSQKRPVWCGGLSLAQYLHVRALYPEVPFDSKSVSGDRLKQFKSDVKDYLTPSDARGLNGRVFDKGRRLSTLHSLLSCADGEALAKAWGLGASAVRKLSRSQQADVESLLQYAVRHASGGFYFPNAVMPYRGLLESELYAHSMLSNLFSSFRAQGGCKDVAEGIRVWMMVQKETQQWGADPAYMDALTTVFHATGETLDLKVMAASAAFTKPFTQIKSAGNGFSISRSYYAQRDGKRVKLSDGDRLVLGEKIEAEYSVSNDENRSFVRLSAPRPACLVPVNQLSGKYGWWLKPLRVSNMYSCTPQGYRNVHADRTEYFFDCYPEGDTVIVEELFVTQDGKFSSAVSEIESLYAPHYRANDMWK